MKSLGLVILCSEVLSNLFNIETAFLQPFVALVESSLNISASSLAVLG